VADTKSGRPRVPDLTRLALSAEAVDQNQYPDAASWAYVCGVRDTAAWAVGWTAEPPVLPEFVAGHLAQDVDAEMEAER
jgi:hypothetical protein